MIVSFIGGWQPSRVATKADDRVATALSESNGGKFGEFARMLKSRLVHVAALGTAIASSEILNTYAVVIGSDSAPMYIWIVHMVLPRVLTLLVVVMACTALQVCVIRLRARMLLTVIGVVAGATAFSALQAMGGWREDIAEQILGESGMGAFLYVFWINATFGGLLAFLYEWQLRANQAMQAVRNERIAGEMLEQQTLESRLSGMKARVDPELLFAVIARAQDIYSEDIEAAEHLLEQLIEFLRATLPSGHEAAATLGQEISLCRAYLELERALRREALTYRANVDADAATVYFPPSVLLPLLQTLVMPRGQTTRPTHLSISTERQLSSVSIDLTVHELHSPPPSAALERATTALRTFFGDTATVVAQSAPFAGTTIRIAIPHVAT